MLSADYSQLELRILAHLCDDTGLCYILSRPSGDVFRIIASKWMKKPEGDVTDDERQQAKQICYGIIYGMGTKNLADQLEVSEDEALNFVHSFHASYPGLKCVSIYFLNNGYILIVIWHQLLRNLSRLLLTCAVLKDLLLPLATEGVFFLPLTATIPLIEVTTELNLKFNFKF